MLRSGSNQMGVTSEEGGGRGLKFHFNNGAKSCRIQHGLVREGSLGKIRSRPGRAVLATGGYQEILAREPISISRRTPQAAIQDSARRRGKISFS